MQPGNEGGNGLFVGNLKIFGETAVAPRPPLKKREKDLTAKSTKIRNL
jgi:hypothetical protein